MNTDTTYNESDNLDPNEQDFALISGYLDGELTQQEAQKVMLLLETRPDYQQLYLELKQMRSQVQSLSLQEQELEHLDQLFNEPTTKVSRLAGLVLLAISVVALIGLTLFKIIFHPELGWFEKSLVVAVTAGTLLLLASVLRQRLKSAKNDKYKRVQL